MRSVSKRRLFFSNPHDFALFGVEIHQVELAPMVKFIQIVLEKRLISSSELITLNILLSSAYKAIVLAEQTTSGKSLINKTKTSGPRIEPCGTPEVI